MAMDPAKLRDEVLRLPLKARAGLVDDLLRSLDDTDEVDPSEHDAAWGAEISERLREVDDGEVKPVPWSEARQRISGGAPATGDAAGPSGKAAAGDPT